VTDADIKAKKIGEHEMKLVIMTDLEGVAGVINTADWIYPQSRYYETAKELLTREVNAAADGFFAAGADEIVVVDGHGCGGINGVLLDPRTELHRGWGKGPYPVGYDYGYDAAAWVGCHPKAGTPFGHICHTGNFDVIDCRINGISVGEFGQDIFLCQQYGVAPIFASGCLAFTKEAEALVPGIETVAVKRGLMEGSGDECDFAAYERRNWAAIHKSPETARKLIRASAEKALRRWLSSPETFCPTKISPPFTMTTRYRPSGGNAAYERTVSHPTDLAAMMNM